MRVPRSRHVVVLLAALLVCAAGAIGAAHASARPKVPCRPTRNSPTVAKSAHARLFEYGAYYYACLYSNGHPYRLSTVEHYEYRLVRFAGPYAAYVINVEASDDSVGEINLRTGRRHAYQPVSAIGNNLTPLVHQVALAPNGDVAWIATNEGYGTPSLTEVRAHDRGGVHVLDSGSQIDHHYLRITERKRRPTIVRWRDAGQARSARLR